MRVDFYQLSRDPAEAVLPQLARNTLRLGERMLVVSGDAAQLERIDRELWLRFPDSFLAHGMSGGPHDARQPILLSDRPEPANGARFMAIADGVWRESPQAVERIFYLFGDPEVEAARDCWRMLGAREGMERHFWKQEGGKWIEQG